MAGFTAQTSFLVILEALHSLEEDFPQRSLDRFREYLVDITWDLIPVPSAAVLERYASLILVGNLCNPRMSWLFPLARDIDALLRI
jgi:hypothetical protein